MFAKVLWKGQFHGSEEITQKSSGLFAWRCRWVLGYARTQSVRRKGSRMLYCCWESGLCERNCLPVKASETDVRTLLVAKIIEIIEESYRGSIIVPLCWVFLLNQASIRRFVFTLITGYLAIFGVQQIPYEFPNQWAVLIPVLIVVYIITVWLDGVFFKDDESPKKLPADVKKAKNKKSSKKSNGFGDS